MIIMFIGPSSSGKDLFFKRTLDRYNFNKIILSTTRPIRNGEVDGREYFFIDMETMDKLDNENKLIERRDYNTVYGIWSYATRSEDINLELNYLTVNTWEAYQKYLDYFGKDFIYPFYFNLDPGIRLERALKREREEDEPKYKELCRRFISDCDDFTKEHIEKYNPIIIDNNGSIEQTDKQIEDNINKILKLK